MTQRIGAVLIAILLAAGIAHAQPAADAGASFEPPHLRGSPDVPYPEGAPPHAEPIVVTVKLRLDAAGRVEQVERVTPPQAPFDDAVTTAVAGFAFEPATFAGKPVPVEITFTHTFLPPPPPASAPSDEAPPLVSMLRGRLVELGTRLPVQGATLTATIGERRFTAEGDQQGRFELPLPEGVAKVKVTAAGHDVFVQREVLAAKQALVVTYLIERDRYDPYEIIVVGEQRREEVSRMELRGAEIKQMPGTFGDPFRVVQALPGVAAVASLLPFPIVRGASPSSTGFLLDATRVPMLYHLLAGPSVVHPDFIDEVDFYPGGAPVLYGGYTGGIIDGRTSRARSDEHLVDIDLNLLQVGGLVRQPIPPLDSTVTVAGRYGYPGLVLGLATDELSLAYWDYQLRIDGGNARNGWTVFAFGARDELDTVPDNAGLGAAGQPLETALALGFHRLDLRVHHSWGRLLAALRGVFGYDETSSQGTAFSVRVAEPALHLTWTQDESLAIVAGVEVMLHDISQGAVPEMDQNALTPITGGLDKFAVSSAFTEALWRPSRAWLLRPGVRADIYSDGETSKRALDPRLTVRYRLAHLELDDVPPDSDESSVWLKGSAGIYHQPPRFVLPLPGFDMMPLRYGLLRSFQTSLGVEVPLQSRIELTAEAYFNSMDPTIFDLSVNDSSIDSGRDSMPVSTSDLNQMDGQEFIDRLTKPQLGRTYGLELLVRRRAKSGIFGWISYTLSRSERLRDQRWASYDFDRTHLFNLVVGLPLRRNWDVGVRMQYQSGRPQTTTAGYNTARNSGYVRFDVRVDKRAVWSGWLLDFYVDITNIALLPEEVQAGTVIRYVLPTVGLRGRF